MTKNTSMVARSHTDKYNLGDESNTLCTCRQLSFLLGHAPKVGSLHVQLCICRAHACIMRQLVLWDIHTNKDGKFPVWGSMYCTLLSYKLNLLSYFDES